MQVIIDGAYKAPREVNFWLGLILMQIVLGLSLTGYLLPWDQKGYWATKVATNIAGITPFVGEQVQALAVGGANYGHHTLTRFFALHAGLLPALLIGFLALHIYVFRRHGITVPDPIYKADTTFWPDQMLKDSVACLAVLAVKEARGNEDYRLAVADAEHKAERVKELAKIQGIGPAGAVQLLRDDPKTRGAALFKVKCASCHRYNGHDGTGKKLAEAATASDLGTFGTRDWIRGMITDPAGATHF